MTGTHQIPFSGQRIISFALVFGMTMYAIVAGVILETNDGTGLLAEPMPVLDTVALVVGCATGLAALVLRTVMTKRAEAAALENRQLPRFLSRIVPMAILELGCLLAITVWMLNGAAKPSLVVACVLLSIAIAIVPFQDPDAEQGNQ